MRGNFARKPLAGMSVLALGLFLSIAPLTAPSARDTLTEEQAAAWVEDLEYFAVNLPALHYDAFNSTSESEFKAQVEVLKAQIPNLTEDQVVVGFSKLASLVKDSHTSMDVYHQATNFFPFQVGYFVGDGPRVLAIQSGYSETLMAKLTMVNGIPLAEVELLLDEAFFTDNTMGATDNYPRLLILEYILDGLNITDGSGQAVFSFQKDGKEFDLLIGAIPFGGDIDWVTVITEDSPTPMYRRQVENPYYYIWNPDLKLLYFAYNSCVERSDLSFDAFTYMLMDAVQEYPFEKFVIDLRHNGGGNSGILDPLIELLADSEKVNQPGTFFVVTSRRTFSSAVLNSISLRQATEAIFVGEPTGAKPNMYGEVRHFSLPNSQLSINYSTNYFHWSSGNRDAFYPDIEVYISLEEFVKGHDPALAAVLAY